MEGSLKRCDAVMRGLKPDRIPLFDLIANDAVLSHFAGRPLTVENAPDITWRALSAAIDGTRAPVAMPQHPATEALPDGRKRVKQRWTTWEEPMTYRSGDDYAAAKRALLEKEFQWDEGCQRELENSLAGHREWQEKLADCFLLLYAPDVSLMELHREVGLVAFGQYFMDYPDLIPALLERSTQKAVEWVAHLPQNLEFTTLFVGDDIAFKQGPMVSPLWLRRHYMPRLHRLCEAVHARGLKLVWHSDGNLNAILDDLVEAGIDALNPIEIAAGMDVADLHRRYPRLVLVGGIDATSLLPFGSPQKVRDAVQRAIEAAGGRILVGSSTEVHNAIPLENFLAMRQAVLDYKL